MSYSDEEIDEMYEHYRLNRFSNRKTVEVLQAIDLEINASIISKYLPSNKNNNISASTNNKTRKVYPGNGGLWFQRISRKIVRPHVGFAMTVIVVSIGVFILINWISPLGQDYDYATNDVLIERSMKPTSSSVNPIYLELESIRTELSELSSSSTQNAKKVSVILERLRKAINSNEGEILLGDVSRLVRNKLNIAIDKVVQTAEEGTVNSFDYSEVVNNFDDYMNSL